MLATDKIRKKRDRSLDVLFECGIAAGCSHWQGTPRGTEGCENSANYS